MNINKSAILLAAFIAVAAVSVRSQSNQRPVQALETAKPWAVVLALQTHYAVVSNQYGGTYSIDDGQIVQYATVSTNGPTGIDYGMNAADAIAAAMSHGRGGKLIHGEYGLYIFAGD